MTGLDPARKWLTPSSRSTRSRLRSARGWIVAAAWIASIAMAKLIFMLLERLGVGRFATPLSAVTLGVIIGLTYGLLAVGLVLIYRTSRIINFAHGQIGAFGAALFGLVVVKYHLPYWIMLPFALLAGGAIGAATEIVVVRRLRNAPRLMSVVATLGVGQFLVMLSIVMNPQAFGVHSLFYYPSPPGLPVFEIGALHIGREYSAMLLLAPLAVIGIASFLRYSRFGLALRASSANPEAARMAGIFAGRMSALAWAIAGAISAFSAILTQAAQGFTTGDSFGPNLLLRALAAAVLARMASLPAALVAGAGLGVVEQLLLWNYPRGGVVEVILFVMILLALLVQRERGGREQEKGSWAAVQALRTVPEALRRIWLVRNLGRIVALAALPPVVLLPLFMSNGDADRLNGIIAFAIIGLAVGVLTGLGGQLTLGQFAVAGVGAVASYLVSSATQSFPLGILSAGVVAALVSALLGLPALRVRGLMLTVTTLSFALAAPPLLTSLLGHGRDPGRPVLPGGAALDTGKTYYWFALTLFALALWLAHNVRRSGFGRLLVAVRDNEDGARAFTVRASLVKLRGYLIAGFIAGIGGAVFGHSLLFIDGSTFPADASIDLVVMTVIGGVAVLIGPILGALFVIGVPAFLPLDSAGLAATQLGLLVLVLYLPSGLAQILGSLRDKVIKLIARTRGVDFETAGQGPTAADPTGPASGAMTQVQPSALPALAPVTGAQTDPHLLGSGVLLEARDLRKRFGGIHAVDGISLEVRSGETVGLIGPNGAGKTTTFELLSGFTRLDGGKVAFDGRDVTYMGPEKRGRLGLIRSFQDALLFPTITVTESVMVALERVRPTTFLSAVTGWTSAERNKERQAREIVSFMGLDRYRDTPTRELSTGTRRIAEIACLVALRPRLLLLDEPSSGIAQRETEALGQLLTDLKGQLDLTLLVIEHDIPLIMGISDRVIAMANGQIIRTGAPDEVQADPGVAEAYLGRDTMAINRSGTATIS